MRHETILKREDKSQVKITIRLSVDAYRNDDPEWKVTIEHKLPRKRTWLGFNTDDYKWRGLEFGSQEREDYVHKWELQYVTDEEILQSKFAMWESIKPKQESE